MKHRWIMLALGCLAACGQATPPGGGSIRWRDGGELETALEEARSGSTPLMVYFTTDW
ncbi:MAG: hypothetical protein HYY16_15315 [Planctomycetes bacterium]|nr:hypothetical protein [Planctomycetota bacterium]